MKKIIATIVLAVGVTLTAPVAANAATCGAYGLTQSANSAAPGAVVSVTVCFDEAPGTPVSTSFDGADVSNGDLFSVTPAVSKASTLGATSSVAFQVAVPTSATNGSVYTISAAAGQSSYSGTLTVVVAPPSGAALPNTGLDIAPWMWVAATALLAVGVVLGVFGLRRARRR